MRHAGIGQQFQCGRSTSNERRVSDERPWLVEKTPKRLGDQSNWTEYVVVYLVGLVKHKPSPVPIAPDRERLENRNGSPLRSIIRRDHPTSKIALFQEYIEP